MRLDEIYPTVYGKAGFQVYLRFYYQKSVFLGEKVQKMGKKATFLKNGPSENENFFTECVF